jgi:hypothetical protein
MNIEQPIWNARTCTYLLTIAVLRWHVKPRSEIRKLSVNLGANWVLPQFSEDRDSPGVILMLE